MRLFPPLLSIVRQSLSTPVARPPMFIWQSESVVVPVTGPQSWRFANLLRNALRVDPIGPTFATTPLNLRTDLYDQNVKALDAEITAAKCEAPLNLPALYRDMGRLHLCVGALEKADGCGCLMRQAANDSGDADAWFWVWESHVMQAAALQASNPAGAFGQVRDLYNHLVEAHGGAHSYLTSCSLDYASAAMACGEHDQAQMAFRLAISQEVPVKSDCEQKHYWRDQFRMQSCLAVVSMLAGEHDAGMEQLTESLKHMVEAFGADSIQVAIAHANLAAAHDEYGSSKAMTHHQKALRIMEAIVGDDHYLPRFIQPHAPSKSSDCMPSGFFPV